MTFLPMATGMAAFYEFVFFYSMDTLYNIEIIKTRKLISCNKSYADYAQGLLGAESMESRLFLAAVTNSPDGAVLMMV